MKRVRHFRRVRPARRSRDAAESATADLAPRPSRHRPVIDRLVARSWHPRTHTAPSYLAPVPGGRAQARGRPSCRSIFHSVVGDRLHRQPRCSLTSTISLSFGSALIAVERHRLRQRLDRLHVDTTQGSPFLVGRIGIDARARSRRCRRSACSVAGVIEEARVALLHASSDCSGPEDCARRSRRSPWRRLDLLVPRPGVGLGFQQPVGHVTLLRLDRARQQRLDRLVHARALPAKNGGDGGRRSASRRSSRAPFPSSTGAVKTPSASLPCAALSGFSTFAERDAEGKIARLRAGAGQDQIAEAGKAHQRLGLARR